MIYVFLAEGFEEIEALATVDFLRRCYIEVVTVGIGSKEVTGAHNITVQADITESLVEKSDKLQGVVLPGGMPGTLNLQNSDVVNEMLDFAQEKGLVIGAICAAPSVLGEKGLLKGKKATCFPGFEDKLLGAEFTGNYAEVDGNIVTGKGAGATIDFAQKIAEKFVDAQKAMEVKQSMQCKM